MFGILPIGPWEIILVLAIVLIIFGPGKLPQVGKMFGKAIGEFRSSVNKKTDETDENKAKEDKQEK